MAQISRFSRHMTKNDTKPISVMIKMCVEFGKKIEMVYSMDVENGYNSQKGHKRAKIN